MSVKAPTFAPLGVVKCFRPVPLDTASPGTSAATSAAQSLGASFASITPVAIAVKNAATALVTVAYLPDTSSTVKFRYQSTVDEAISIVATFECEV